MNAKKNNFYNINDYIPNFEQLSNYLLNNIDLLLFTTVFFSLVNRTKFSIAPHHKTICNKLNEILKYEHPTNHVIINIPPRCSKTELAVISFISYAFALNPSCEFMHFSSSESLVNRNSTNIRKIIDSDAYKIVFPQVELTNNAKGSITTTQGGVLYTAPFLGQITGFGCGKFRSEKFAGAMVIDDPVKTQSALSEVIMENVNFTYANTLKSRKNDTLTPIIVIGQRVGYNDFCGHLIETEGTIDNGGKWDLISIPAILDEGLSTERSLWERRLLLEDLKKQKELDDWVFSTQYLQNPRPISGLVFPSSETKYYDEIPQDPDLVFCQIDPADGGDYTCSVVYYVKDEKVFVVDVIYVSESSDITIPKILNQLKNFGVSMCVIESNSGWSLFRRTIKEKVSELGLSTSIRSVNQRLNKEIRIFQHAQYIINNFYYSKNGNNEYKMYLKHKHSYIKLGRGQKDDGVDTDCSCCEYLKKNGFIPLI